MLANTFRPHTVSLELGVVFLNILGVDFLVILGFIILHLDNPHLVLDAGNASPDRTSLFAGGVIVLLRTGYVGRCCGFGLGLLLWGCW